MSAAGPKTRTVAIRAAVVPPLPVRVRVVRSASGGAPPPPLDLASGTATIGAASTCDLVLDDGAVSRRHVALELLPEGVLVRDLESRNGTFYLGQRIERMIASPGVVLEIGGTSIAIELAPDAVAGDEPLRLGGFRGMIGASAVMQSLFGKIARLDGSLLPVLVLGETGVGKELVARALHEGSRVAEGPFVAVNCGAIARELVASTLFGHRKGAFTGATDTRRGAFGAADGGTLFLDEIGELPLDVQPMLLRALETGEVTALGEDTPRKVSVRVVAATHRDLLAEARRGGFREDLYYRIGALTLRVPSLRERADDVPLLADAIARQEGAAGLPADVLDALTRQTFPGNVRELRNAVRAYVALGELGEAAARSARGEAGGIEAALASVVRLDRPFLEQRDEIAKRFTEIYVARLLEESGGNQTLAAKIAGLDRTYLGRLLAKLGHR
ncbi:MAG: sigma 54-dependent Fis family transcriptional regulator [Labilithrix sp.]|nr:sigma 54-dependent Fis family transcriptional regulator [Labilithrix sp.]